MWLPIETAPKDRAIIVYRQSGVIDIVWWRSDRQLFGSYDWVLVENPTHWTPLPQPPPVPCMDAILRVKRLIAGESLWTVYNGHVNRKTLREDDYRTVSEYLIKHLYGGNDHK